MGNWKQQQYKGETPIFSDARLRPEDIRVLVFKNDDLFEE